MRLKIDFERFRSWMMLGFMLLMMNPWLKALINLFWVYGVLVMILVVGSIYYFRQVTPYKHNERDKVFQLSKRSYLLSGILMAVIFAFLMVVFNLSEEQFWVFSTMLLFLELSRLIHSYLRFQHGHYNLTITPDKMLINEDEQNVIHLSEISEMRPAAAETYLVHHGLKKKAEYIYIYRVVPDQKEELVRYLDTLALRLPGESNESSETMEYPYS